MEETMFVGIIPSRKPPKLGVVRFEGSYAVRTLVSKPAPGWVMETTAIPIKQ